MFDDSEVKGTASMSGASVASQVYMMQKWIEIFKMFVAPGLLYFTVAALAAYCLYDATVLRIIALGVFSVFSLIFLMRINRVHA